MARPKGLPKTGGRAKGTPNKVTASVKQALEEAFDRMGGIEVLTAWAEENPGEFFKIWSRILPKELAIDATMEHRMTLEEYVCGSYDDGENNPN